MICKYNLVSNPPLVCISLTDILVGPSAAMSIPAIYFAFHVEKAISIWEGLKNPLLIFWPKVEDKSKTNHDGTYANSLIFRVLNQNYSRMYRFKCYVIF